MARSEANATTHASRRVFLTGEATRSTEQAISWRRRDVVSCVLWVPSEVAWIIHWRSADAVGDGMNHEMVDDVFAN